MFPIDYQVNVRRGQEVTKYALLENQNDQYLVVLHPSLVEAVTACTKSGSSHDDGLVALLADEAMVLDRKKGTMLPLEKASALMAKSKHPAIRRAATFRTPLPALSGKASGADLALAFSLEIAKRRMSA